MCQHEDILMEMMASSIPQRYSGKANSHEAQTGGVLWLWVGRKSHSVLFAAQPRCLPSAAGCPFGSSLCHISALSSSFCTICIAEHQRHPLALLPTSTCSYRLGCSVPHFGVCAPHRACLKDAAGLSSPASHQSHAAGTCTPSPS